MITVTLQQIVRTCDDWEQFFEDKGYNEYAVMEGGGDVEVTMTIQEAVDYGIIENMSNKKSPPH